ncbi:MAG TPA: metal-sensing transcriptional repressor [Clostridiales bacterium]|nr:metal-sensing transcriptional repressor [Clostridiales bacterium]
MAEQKTCCCSPEQADPGQTGKTKIRTPAEQKALLNRLKRIEGQIRGLEKMVEDNAYCPDILVQASAAGSALHSFSKELLGRHLKTCVVEDIRQGNDEVVDELLATLQKMMK